MRGFSEFFLVLGRKLFRREFFRRGLGGFRLGFRGGFGLR
jgi:hypothetical protein